jgi:hypothetical protein
MEKLYDGCKATYGEEPFCEHCGENFEDFAVTFDDDGIERCIDCFNCEHDLSKEDFNFIRKKEDRLTIEYYERMIKDIKTRKYD